MVLLLPESWTIKFFTLVHIHDKGVSGRFVWARGTLWVRQVVLIVAGTMLCL